MSLNFFKILILTGSIANALHLTNSGSKNHIASWGKILASKGKTLASILPLSVVLTASSVPVQAEVIQSSPTTIASGSSKNTPFYFGIGCFWHVQHEFVLTEKSVLNRANNEISSVVGYAGGTKVGKIDNYGAVQKVSAGKDVENPVVCYHNMANRADYGSMGHGEVVQLQIPLGKYRDFANEYFSLFGSDLERPDKGDRGLEYRSLVGLPGGTKSPQYAELLSAANAKGMKLVDGKGNDADTLGKKQVWVMDSDAFPFYQAEVYHQFHDGFMLGEQYPQSYNAMIKESMEAGFVKPTYCPDSFF